MNTNNFSQRISGTTEQPELEILNFPASKLNKPYPLLFIHCFSGGAWMFAENYASFFNHQGYDVFALNLRGHGQSQGKETVNQASLQDYFQDVVRAIKFVKSLTETYPVVIGHSIGSILTRLYIQDYELPGAILMSFGDVKTAFSAFMIWSMKNFPVKSLKMMISGKSEKMYGHFEPHFRILFTKTDNRLKLKPFVQRFVEQPESDRVFQDVQQLPPIQRGTGKTPVAIIVGDRDPIAPKKSVEILADLYQSSPVFIANKAHDLFVCDGWEQGADEILKWLEKNHL
ncbi:alpha/beta hydrolase [Pleurocapsa sp. PCC 7319]|uniref:alpha/beta hydrolase n=1 Tax=Pleurocapsa sp. PCC 7319 TaxID=118161 RepID=UPI000347A40E|nr:alpha/beta hydrolase [Pleurocapsa sp. PCC 7319]